MFKNEKRGYTIGEVYKNKPSKGGGDYITEEATVESIEEFWERLRTNELYNQNVKNTARNFHGNKIQATMQLGKGTIEKSPHLWSEEDKQRMIRKADNANKRIKEHMDEEEKREYDRQQREKYYQEFKNEQTAGEEKAEN